LENELDEQKELLNHYDEKTKSAKLNFDVLKKACRELRDKLIGIHNEQNSLEKLVYEFTQ
jgi:ATP/maltotriose-dependent transcriptional regulator MalT